LFRYGPELGVKAHDLKSGTKLLEKEEFGIGN
jgi:hypothetical protein